MNRIFLFFYFIIIFSTNFSFAGINVTNFKENIKFTKDGREVTVTIKAEIGLDNPNFFYKEWDYIFDKRSKIQVLDAKVQGREFQSSFKDNDLKFKFARAFNGDQLEFDFKYLQFNDNKAIYTRQDQVSIPEFAKGANGSLTVIIPDELEVYSINPLFTQNSNIYTWEGKVPNEGLNDFFYLTLKRAKWKINLTTQVVSEDKISKVDIKIPAYFKNGNNSIEKYSINTNQLFSSTQIKEDEDNININFNNLESKDIKIVLEAVIKNDFSNKIWIMLDPNKYLDIDDKIGGKLTDIIFKLRQNPVSNEQLYMILAKWVHNYITYDINYYGKEMDSLTILNEKRGVCEHYARLYNDLLRTAGIPSIIISGVSYDIDKSEFENHAWNLVYNNGDWIQVDPTWGLYSGEVPVSHIFFYYDDRPVINYTIYNTNSNKFKSIIKKDIKFIDE